MFSLDELDMSMSMIAIDRTGQFYKTKVQPVYQIRQLATLPGGANNVNGLGMGMPLIYGGANNVNGWGVLTTAGGANSVNGWGAKKRRSAKNRWRCQ